MLPAILIFFACLLALAWLFYRQREQHRLKREEALRALAAHKRWAETLTGIPKVNPRDRDPASYGEYQEKRRDR